MNIKRKTLFPALLAVFFILIAVFLTHIGTSKKKLEQITSKFQKEIIEQELLAENGMNQIRSDLLNHVIDSSSAVGFLNREKYFEPEITFLIYQNDSLIFWSSNNVPISEASEKELTENLIIELPNGEYDIRFIREGNFTIVGLVLIKHQYVFENQFLINSFNSCFDLPAEIQLQFVETGSYPIYNKDQAFLFSLDFSAINLPTESALNFIILFYIIAYCLILFSLYQAYLMLASKIKLKILLVVAFIIDVLIIRFAILYFEIPHVVYKSILFSPDYLATSRIFASPGDLLLNVITIFIIAYSVFKSAPIKLAKFFQSRIYRYLIGVIALFIIFFLFQWTFSQIHEIILNSTISFNLSNISSISLYTQLGIFSIGMLLLSAFFLVYHLILFIKKEVNTFGYFILFSSIVLMPLTLLFNSSTGVWINLLMIFLLFTIIWYSDNIFTNRVKLIDLVYLILLFSLYATYIFHISNYEKEREKRKVFAEKILLNRDPLAEYKFMNIAEEMKADTILDSLLANYPFSRSIDQERVNHYLLNRYFENLLEKYEVQITLCDSSRILDLQPDNFEINCLEYFKLDLISFGQTTDSKDFFYMDYELENDNYLGHINLDTNTSGVHIFIELFPKNIPKGLGYPELLADKKNQSDLQWADYSFAKFRDKQLINWFGRYFYSTNFLLGQKVQPEPKSIYINKNGYNHLIYQRDSKTILVVSKKNLTWLDIVAPFSYLSIFFGILIFIFVITLRGGGDVSIFPLSFKKRVQLVITSLVIFSFLFIGTGSLFYLTSLNNQKNHDILKEKAHSVLIELEHKLAEEEDLPISMQPYLNDLLYKFSLVFFSDINLYSLDGKLLASSRPEIFNKGLISSQMDPNAYTAIHFEGSSFFIQNEEIGDYQYLSAFMPFRNAYNQLIAYINLPYFAKQDELTNEISTFLVAFINIYIIFITLAIYMALIISNYITRPLQLLKEKIGGLKLGTTEAKIEWKKKDEIGELVIEYNRMVDELAMSAEKLIKSERESAWREMAKQIAHEIKNPLTPMKLSVQYLQKAWNDDAPDWDQRLKRFTQTIVEQINSLSIIASEFSDFAKMPRSKFREIDLAKVIHSTIDLFVNTTSIQFKFDIKDDCFVYADKEQLLRVFNNLIKNSIQAISNEKEGYISIAVSRDENNCKVVFSDNGKGIPISEQSKVFSPNFTTKSGGMGLGLAMVKNIIQNANGSITFSSIENEGTTFIILLPLPPLTEKIV